MASSSRDEAWSQLRSSSPVYEKVEDSPTYRQACRGSHGQQTTA